MPHALTQPSGGLGEIVTAHTDTYLVQQMHALALSIYQAKQRNDRTTVAALLQRFEMLADEYRSHGDADLTATDRFILAVNDWIETSVDAIPSAIAALPTAIGKGLISAAIPFAVLFAGYVVLRNWGRK